MTDTTTTLTGTIPAQTIQVSITIPAQTVSVILDETELAAALRPLMMSTAPTVVTTTTGGIVDSQGNIYTLTAGAQIAVNGVTDTTTANVVTLAYIAPTAGAPPQIYQVNTAGNAYTKTSASAPWVATTFPTIAT